MVTKYHQSRGVFITTIFLRIMNYLTHSRTFGNVREKSVPQIYGTQVQDGKLRKIDNLDSVRIPRQLLNMMTLEDYLKMMEVEMQ